MYFFKHYFMIYEKNSDDFATYFKYKMKREQVKLFDTLFHILNLLQIVSDTRKLFAKSPLMKTENFGRQDKNLSVRNCLRTVDMIFFDTKH